MLDASKIGLSETTKRLFARWYPVCLFLILINGLGCVSLNYRPDYFPRQLLTLQVVCLFIYLSLIFPLYVIKPTQKSVRLAVMVVSMLFAVTLANELDGFFESFYNAPLSGSITPAYLFLGKLEIGIFILWFFHIEECQYLAETKITAEKSKRILNEKKLAESHLKLLQAQIEPHFLFNTLTSIVSLGYTDPPKAKAMQMDFIQYLKTTLVKTRSSVTTIGQEIDLIRAYLDIFEVRMGKRLHYTIDAAKEIYDLPFPSVLIQPIVENAVKHGLEPKIEGGEVHIQVTRLGKVIRWVIADTGLGLFDKADLGLGLTNTMERLEALFGNQGRLIMEDNSPSGLKVIVEAPYG